MAEATVDYSRQTDRLKTYRISLIRTYLIERGIQISWFLRQTGATESQFHKVERGDRQPPGTYRAAASLALGEAEDRLVLKVQARDREDIVIERDEADHRRITRVKVVDRHGPNTVEDVVWALEDAPWVARR